MQITVYNHSVFFTNAKLLAYLSCKVYKLLFMGEQYSRGKLMYINAPPEGAVVDKLH